MIHKTKGIALNYIKYRDTSIISKIFTEEFGLQTYIVNGVRSKTSKKNKIAFFQPMSLLDLVVYYNDKKDIQRISEIKFDYLLRSVQFKIKKSSIALFLSEILVKCLVEEKEPRVFKYCYEGIRQLDQKTSHYENFHLIFLLGLGQLLGIAPHSFDIFEIEHDILGNIEEIESVKKLFLLDYDADLKINKKMRKQLLEKILECYTTHFHSIRDLKSLPVLREIMA